MSKKALFFDIDGTLLSEKTRCIPESAVEAIEKARAKGHLAFINTGRAFSHVGKIQRLLDMDGYLCGCGTYLYMQGRVMYHASAPRELYRKVCGLAEKCRVDLVWEGERGLAWRDQAFTEKGAEFLNQLKNAHDVTVLPWEDDCQIYNKFCMQTGPESDRTAFFENIKDEFEIIDRGRGFYECPLAGHSKATAIDFVLRRYGILLRDAYVFGDSTNDFPMFEYAQNSVLMGDHDIELEPYASFITRRVEEDGIEFAMESLKII